MEGRDFMVFEEQASLQEKLRILTDAAKYDVACTSSGVERKGKQGELGNTAACGICHSFSGDGRCISLLKILFTNECIYNCKYCINRATNDVPRATFTPEEICELTMEFYRRNYIEGLFLSSGIVQSPDYTMELIAKALRDLRIVHHFNGYIHCKTIPGASAELVELVGWYADRMSVNLELPTAEGLKQVAPNKSRKNILLPMRQIQSGMAESQQVLGMKGGNKSAYWYTSKRMGRSLPGGQMISENCQVLGKGNPYHSTSVENANRRIENVPSPTNDKLIRSDASLLAEQKKQPSAEGLQSPEIISPRGLTQWKHQDTSRGFVPAGQSTQMIIGATGETDYEILSVSEALYRNFDLKRVFFSAFINVNQDASLMAYGEAPLRREHRLYQADWLLRFYGFEAQELLSESHPNFNVFLDPKCDWALSHMEEFPIEINQASYNTLLRVPGIGVKSAGRICAARKTGRLDYYHLKKLGVVLKRAIYFITCNGRMMYDFIKVEEDYITRALLGQEQEVLQNFSQQNIQYKQLSLFDDWSQAALMKNGCEA